MKSVLLVPTSIGWFRSRFPEDLFPCISGKEIEYTERILHGYEIARRSTVVIGGLVRDIAQILPTTLSRIEHLSSLFFDANFVIFENDSTDRSPDILLDWQPECPKFIVSKKLNRPKFGSIKCEKRIDEMIYYRTELQKRIAAINNEEPSDYVILLDMDIEGGFSYDGILNSLSFNMDAVASNSLFYENDVRRFYDSYALKTEKPMTDLEKQSLIYHRGQNIVRVESAFGGLCIYKMDKYLDGVYHTDDAEHWCEHQGFHKKMKIGINPSQITLYNKTRYSI